MMWGYGFSWGGMLLMTLGSVLSLALLGALVWAIIRCWINGKTANATPLPASTPPSGPSAIEILRQRYARGEIDTPTFEQMREQLESSGTRSYQQSDGDQSVMSGR